jgi:hypothetical protein
MGWRDASKGAYVGADTVHLDGYSFGAAMVTLRVRHLEAERIPPAPVIVGNDGLALKDAAERHVLQCAVGMKRGNGVVVLMPIERRQMSVDLSIGAV